jgi:imidazolonepropionase-like amidohydrolase
MTLDRTRHHPPQPAGCSRRLGALSRARRRVLLAGLVPAGLLAGAACGRAPAPSPGSPASAAAAEAQVLVIEHVAVVDVERGEIVPDRTVVVRGDRIASVGASGENGPRAVRVDGRGKYLMPGLIDAHTHVAGVSADPRWSPEVVPAEYVSYGVTGVRDMGSDLDVVLKLREAIDARATTGPRIATGGPMLDRHEARAGDARTARTAAEGRAAVDELAGRGVDFIKVISPTRDAYLAIAEEAARRKLFFVGHVPEEVTAAEASDRGQRSIEHLSGIPLSCSAREAELREKRRAALAARDGAALRAAGVAILASYDPARCAELFARFVKNGTWQVPTLVWTHAGATLDRAREDDPRLLGVPPSVRAQWKPASLIAESPGYMESMRDVLALDLVIVRAMSASGVHILAGSDSLDPFVFPGSSLHEELALLVEAGLSTAQALRSATVDPARFLGWDAGVVAPGKRADLVLLEADPLANIGATTRIAAVVLRGELLGSARLTELRARAEAAAAAVRD